MTKTNDTAVDLLETFLHEELKEKNFKSGNIVRIHRERLSLAQEDLAKLTKIPLKNIKLYEANEKVIGLTIATKLAAALSISHNSILFPNGFK